MQGVFAREPMISACTCHGVVVEKRGPRSNAKLGMTYISHGRRLYGVTVRVFKYLARSCSTLVSLCSTSSLLNFAVLHPS